MGGAFGVGKGKFRGGLAGFGGGKGGVVQGEGEQGQKEEMIHKINISRKAEGSSGREKMKNSGFGVRGHAKHWFSLTSGAEKRALGSEVKIGGERESEREGLKGYRLQAGG